MKTILTLALVASLAILTSSASAQIRVPQESVSLYDHLQVPLESVSMYDHLQIPSVFGPTPNNLRSKTTEAKLVDWATMTDDQILLVLLMVDSMYDHLQIPSVFSPMPNNLRSKTTEAKLVD